MYIGIIQRKAVRLICNTDSLAHTNELFKELYIRTFSELVQYITAILMFHLFHGTLTIHDRHFDVSSIPRNLTIHDRHFDVSSIPRNLTIHDRHFDVSSIPRNLTIHDRHFDVSSIPRNLTIHDRHFDVSSIPRNFNYSVTKQIYYRPL